MGGTQPPWQVPPTQGTSGMHEKSQKPQLAGSVSVSTHLPAQQVCVPWQAGTHPWHWPLASSQCSSAGQRPQVPVLPQPSSPHSRPGGQFGAQHDSAPLH